MNPKVDLVLRVLVAAALTFMGIVPKLMGDPTMLANFERWGYPAGFHRIVAGAELISVVLLLVPKTALYGAAGVVAVMLGAVGTHLKAGEYGFAPIPLAIGLVAAWVGWQRYRRR